ncbi:MAG: hypothetical protein H7X77_04425, partial [Anaerolineae bacterium]|nr:hypothetical protein [Anaerolineae bacterium]
MEFTDQDYDLLSAYLDNDLSAGDRAALESRLVAEPLLQRELAALRQTVQVVNSLPPLKAPRDFVLTPAMASDKIIAFPGQQRSRLLKFGLPILSAAASVLVILIGLGALLSSQSLQSPTSGSTAPQADVAALSSATTQLTLDATLTLDGLPLDQTLLTTEDIEQAAESEIQTETDDEASIMMEMGIPSASPSLDDF